jgi:hypothetical protein
VWFPTSWLTQGLGARGGATYSALLLVSRLGNGVWVFWESLMATAFIRSSEEASITDKKYDSE